jgi:hypothetical protein
LPAFQSPDLGELELGTQGEIGVDELLEGVAVFLLGWERGNVCLEVREAAPVRATVIDSD